MQNALIFLVKTLTDLYLLTFLLRFIMQWTRADFYNPFAEVILRVTNPLVVPARRLLPSAAGIDLPTLIVLIVLEAAATLLLLGLIGASVPFGTFLVYVVLRLVNLTLWFYTIAIFVYVILSWIGQGRYSPIGAILADLVEPVLRPARRILPPIAGLDLSPLLVLILLQAIVIALPLPSLLR
jgi:YggT family protein